MVFNVRCFKCGEHEVRLVMGGRSIIHAQCQACDTNLLAEVMEFQRRIEEGEQTAADAQEAEDTAPDETVEPVSTSQAVQTDSA